MKGSLPTPLMSDVLDRLRPGFDELSMFHEQRRKFETLCLDVFDLCRAQFEKFEATNQGVGSAAKIAERILKVAKDMRDKMLRNSFEDITSHTVARLLVCLNNSFQDFGGPVVVHPLLESNLPVYSGQLERSIEKSIYDTWKLDQSREPVFEFNEKSTSIEISRKRPEGFEVSQLSDDAVRKLENLDDSTCDVYFLHIAHWRESRDDKGYAWMTGATILEDRDIVPKIARDGLKPYNEGHRGEDIDAVYDRVQQLEHLWVNVKSVDMWSIGKGGKKRKKTFSREGRVMVISERIRQTSKGEGQGRVYAWKYKLYEGLEDLVMDNRFAFMSRKVFTYHPDQQRPEKRIGRFVAIHFKINNMNPITREVSTIFDYCRISHDKTSPQKSKTRFEKALNTLVADGVMADWNYFVKGEKVKAPELKPRNWWEQYQGLSLLLEPSPEIPKVKRPDKPFKSVS